MKMLFVNYTITDHTLDALYLTEPWLKRDDYITLNESTHKIMVINTSYDQKVKGEELVKMYSNIFSVSQRSGFKYNSFEAMVLKITSSR